MAGGFTLDILAPAELEPGERALWAAFRAASPRYDSPYFDLRYILAAGRCAPHAQVAVIRRAGMIAGFFAFQRRGRLVQPLGAPMTDYHGVLAAPGETLTTADILPRLQGRAFRFSGLTEAPGARAAPVEGLVLRRRMVADLSGGFEAWEEARRARSGKFLREKQRTLRAIDRELGPVRLDFSAEPGEALDFVLKLKRAQYRRTRRHDVFACGWTESLVRSLAHTGERDFGLRFATLRAGEHLLGAEIGLLSGGVYHLWLPAYDPAFARFGPGALTTLETLRILPQAGVTRVDFGRDDAPYKAYFADPAEEVLEGLMRPAADPGLTRALAWINGPHVRLAAVRERIGRRFDVISACETTAMGWCAGALLALGVAATAAVPMTAMPQSRRPHVQRLGPHMVARAEGRIRHAAGGVPTSAG